MQEDQQKQLKDMKENIGYYQKKAQELEVRYSSPDFARYSVWMADQASLRQPADTIQNCFVR